MRNTVAIFLLLWAVVVVRADPPRISGCDVFSADNIWNTRVDSLPVHSNSAAYINTIGTNGTLHPDFGSGEWPPGSGAPIGIPYIVVPGTQALVTVTFDYFDESDPGPYPIPTNAPIEGGPAATGDRHVIVLDEDHHQLYELWNARTNADGTWSAGSGAIFDLDSNTLRSNAWTSADAAGLPVLPGLVRYDEVAAGAIEHAIRFTVPQTRRAYLWPARHYASSLTGEQYPPMGLRFRLKSSCDTSGFSQEARVILVALKKYGMILADNGSAWYISGTPDERWNNDVLNELKQVKGKDFEAIDESSLMLNADSGAVRYPRVEIQTIAYGNEKILLTISNLFPGVSNIVEQSTDLLSGAWQPIGGFYCETTVTNWLSATNMPAGSFFRTRRL